MGPGNWNLYITGISHQTSTLEQREPLQINRNDMARANATFSDLAGVKESSVLSTCNRVEFYFTVNKREVPFELIKTFYENFNGLDISEMENLFYIRKNKHTAAHMLNVASGMDSMVIGENQILGQLKDAYSSACAVKSAGKVLHHLYHQAFRVGKQVRTDTEMGKGSCSVSSAAIELLEDKVKNLSSPNVLFIGINQMISLATKGVFRLDHGDLYYVNRTVEKAKTFAAAYSAEGYGLESIPKLLAKSDIVISCTGSEKAIITGDMLDKYLESNPNRKLILVDLAIPRDIDMAKDFDPAIELYDLEDIKEHVEEHRQKRELAIPQAQEIIDRKLSEFTYWFEHLRYEPLYNGLGETFESIRQNELSGVMSRLSPEVKEEIERATRSMVDKLLQLKVRTSE